MDDEIVVGGTAYAISPMLAMLRTVEHDGRFLAKDREAAEQCQAILRALYSEQHPDEQV